jgi:hypothetical protein
MSMLRKLGRLYFPRLNNRLLTAFDAIGFATMFVPLLLHTLNYQVYSGAKLLWAIALAVAGQPFSRFFAEGVANLILYPPSLYSRPDSQAQAWLWKMLDVVASFLPSRVATEDFLDIIEASQERRSAGASRMSTAIWLLGQVCVMIIGCIVRPPSSAKQRKGIE